MVRKRNGFTLGEILLAVLIVGIVAVLTLPSLIKDTTQKARMSLLKSTIGNISNAVQAVLVKERTNDVTDTDVYKDPQEFLKTFDAAEAGTPFAASYKRLSDSQNAAGVLIPSNSGQNQAAYLLKSGVGLGIVNDSDQSISYVVIDLTGKDKPNIVGVDYFLLKIDWYDDESKYVRSGDVTAFKDENETKEGLKTSCKGGNGADCYRLVELSGYDPHYLD